MKTIETIREEEIFLCRILFPQGKIPARVQKSKKPPEGLF